MASAGTRAAAVLVSFSAILFLFLLLQASAPGLAADLLASALDRFLDGRGGLLELATRRNMILLCHAILLVILRDAGVLGTPAASRRSPPGEATPANAAVAETAAPAPARPHATRTAVPAPARPRATRSAVVWRSRPRNRGQRLVVVECCQPGAEAAATWAAPALLPTTGPAAAAHAAEEAPATSKQIVLAVESPRNENDDGGQLDHHGRGRDAVAEPLDGERPTAITLIMDGERDDCDDRRIVAVLADDATREQQTAGMEMEMEMELADDRTFEEFIKSQRRKMRQESLLHYHSQQAIAATRY